MRRIVVRMLAAAAVLLAVSSATAQITLPPNGDNQKASVTQYIGLVKVSIDYNSPDVHGPDGKDRTGHIWGELVPFGPVNLGFGTCTECPWRGGANENTTFSVSHDVLVEGQALPAGTYGLHMFPGPEEWTLVFSKNFTSWGSFFYDSKEDALRVKVKPSKSEYHEWLTYEFTDREPDKAVVALQWENLQVPWTIAVPDAKELYIAKIREELRNAPGFAWQSWAQAAQYAVQNQVDLPEALEWAQKAVSLPGIGQENFTTLSALAQLQTANGKTAEAKATMDKAVRHPTAGVFDLHQYGRQLLASGEKEAALRIFELNAKLHPKTWPVNVGLARGYSAVGRTRDALKYAKLALAEAPDELNRTNLETMVKELEGK